jgi:putative MATE family efflux protein
VRLRSQWDREILRLAVPAFGALIAEPVYVLSDTAIVGHLGTPQLAGLAVAAAILVTGYSVFIFLAYGTTAAVARLIGAGDEREATHQAVQGVWLAAAVSVPVTAAGLGLAGPLVRGFGASGAAAGYAETYLRVSALGLPAVLLTYAAVGWLRGRQDTRTPLAVAIGSAAVNLVLEVVLILGLGYGVGASAASTVVVQWAAAAVYLLGLGRQATSLSVGLRPVGRSVGRLARVGLDLLVRTVALRLALTSATAVAARLGAAQVGAHQIAFELWNTLALALDAVAIAAQALVGRLLGAGDVTAARAATRRMVELGLAFGVLVGVVLLALRTVLPHAFTDDPLVLHLAAFVLLFAALLQPVNAVVFVLDGVLMGAGDMRYLAVSTVAAAVLFLLLAGVLVATGAGLGWLWTAIGALMLARLTVLVARLRTDAWLVTGATRWTGSEGSLS